ncbi:MAG: 2-nitropropane dioxygenase [Dehalococcoidia bacterium]|nr:2-nitropropane dioxygenase [Dehalococcoidia bacterium]
MLHTRVCDLLGIQYPIIQGGLGHISGGELAAAVSNAGGLGTIALTTRSPELYVQEKWPISVRNEIKLTKSLTKKPFAVNVPMDNYVHEKFVEAAIYGQLCPRKIC